MRKGGWPMADEQTTGMPETPEAPQTPPPTEGGGLDPKLGALLAYLFGFLGGLIVYLTQKDKFMRFHGMQSIMLSASYFVVAIGLGIISGILAVLELGCISLILAPVQFLLWVLFIVASIYMMVKAYGGEKTKLPVIGDMAEKYV
ncbi:MAG: DUF4870 domain-containing protein [Actinobacteria bacterium]|nr:MAG: DUF4870 domain-containing protein [Actinomycetota bacterium]